MWMRRFALLALVVLTAVPGLAADKAPGAGAKDFFFKDGDTIVMIGDSITEQHLYSNYVEMWTVSRFPTWKLTFRNVGIGGDVSPGGNSRFKRDVLAHKPTAMTVDFGMNDGGYGGFDEGRFRRYMNGLQGMADQARQAKVRVAWITPQPIERREPGAQLTAYNQTLEKFSAGVKDIAEKNDGLFVDQFHPYLAVMERARAQDPAAVIMGGDAVHPGPPGQSVMAWAILKGLHFPRLVSAVDIDLKTNGAAKATNCQVGTVATKKDKEGLIDHVSFERKDNALPFFPAEAKSILARAPVLEDLNDYGLKIGGLAPGRYVVRLGGKKVADDRRGATKQDASSYEILLGGKKVAEYTSEELAKGVNLAGPALAVGPVADQVSAVWKAVQDKNRYFHDRIFRGVVLANPQAPDWLDTKLSRAEVEQQRQAAFAKRMERMPALDEAVRLALLPRAHQVEVVKVGQ